MNLDLSNITGFEAEISGCNSIEDLQNVKIKYLGKKGLISLLNKQIPTFAPEERKEAGEKIQGIRAHFESLFNEHFEVINKKLREETLKNEYIDVTMQGFPFEKGSLHPVYRAYDDIVDIFTAAGYETITGPEVEDDYHNFEALNIPAAHPARDMQDTFYIHDNIVLRTQTSSVQIRTMENKRPPIKVISPGKVYRCDYDVTHSPMFHQVEGLVVDKGITFGDLKGALRLFISRMFGSDLSVRLRPSFFPFTEPSAEVDMGCVQCRGKGCRMCKGTGWLEIGGCGMVNPAVFKFVNIDPAVYTGFAFGMGIERIAMLKYGIDDIRLFYENSLKFLRQF